MRLDKYFKSAGREIIARQKEMYTVHVTVHVKIK